jgi:diguanylate cyclase (GGDEF)-like protein
METDAPTEAGGGTARILVADDSALVRTIVRRTLEQGGHSVEEASDGASALRLLEAAPFDVVISDLSMPGLDGFAVLSAVKERGLSTEVIILTGARANDMRSAIRALRLGAHDYLTKPPASADEILLAVERALDTQRLQEANRRLVRELEMLSRTDGLTGLLNRRAFDESLLREVARARRYGVPLSVVLFDLDHFKRINDTYGHAGGDEVLRIFAAQASHQFREADTLYRYGGEEFVALLPHTDVNGARQAAERLCRTLRAVAIHSGAVVIRATCSAGVAELAASDADPTSLLRRADAALYAAKAKGRDRVEALLDLARRRRRARIAVPSTHSVKRKPLTPPREGAIVGEE